MLWGQIEILTGLVGLGTEVTAIATTQDTVQNPLLIAQAAGISTIIALLTGKDIDPDNIKPGLHNFKKLVKEAVNEWFEENKKDIYQQLTTQIAETIVGESYLKFDSNSTYYPTLLFKFMSNNQNQSKRYSQIQIRLLKSPEEIDEALINQLKKEASKLKQFYYLSGPIRCNYIAPKRLFKTTVFTKTKTETDRLFNAILPLGGNEFVKNQLSYTELSKRLPYTRAETTPRKDIQINPVVKLEVRKEIKAIFLQVNGWNKMVRLF